MCVCVSPGYCAAMTLHCVESLLCKPRCTSLSEIGAGPSGQEPWAKSRHAYALLLPFLLRSLYAQSSTIRAHGFLLCLADSVAKYSGVASSHVSFVCCTKSYSVDPTTPCTMYTPAHGADAHSMHLMAAVLPLPGSAITAMREPRGMLASESCGGDVSNALSSECTAVRGACALSELSHVAVRRG